MYICVYMYIWVDGLKGSKVDYLTRSGPKARRIIIIIIIIITTTSTNTGSNTNSPGLWPRACQITDITSHQPINPSIQPINPSTHQLID